MDAEELMKALENARELLENNGVEDVHAYLLPCQIEKMKELGCINTSADGQDYILGIPIKEWLL